MTVSPQELLATPIIIPHRADGLPRALPGVRAGVGRDPAAGLGSEASSQQAPWSTSPVLLFWALSGWCSFLPPRNGGSAQKMYWTRVPGASSSRGGARTPHAAGSHSLSYTLLPTGVHCGLALPGQLQVLRWLVPRATLPLRFPGAGNQSCSLVFLPKKQCLLGPECFHVGKEGKRSNIS